MKKIIPLLTCIILAGCSVHRLHGDYIAYNENVDFKILTFTSSKFSEGVPGDRVTYIGTGGRYKMAVIAVSNKSDQEQTIDFENFKLLDDQGNEYIPIYAAPTVTSTYNKNKVFQVKAGKQRKFAVDFWPIFPKGQEVKRILVHGKEISLQ